MKTKLITLLLAGIIAVLPSTAFADTDVTASNESADNETESGEASASNDGSAFVGLEGGGSTGADAEEADVESSNGTNVQEGDNELDVSQDATSTSGDTVGGQVIGAVVSGDLTVDATNLSEDIDAASGDANSTNDFSAFVGLSNASETAIGADVNDVDATNVQEGDNSADLSQRTDAVTGDAVGGQVFGATVSGTTDAVLANTSEDADVTSGDADEVSDSELFTGLLANGTIEI